MSSMTRETDSPDDAAAEAGQAPPEERLAELEARWLRAQADYQNLKRRTQAELDAALLRTLQPLFGELLLVLDYLDLALGAPATGEEARKIAEGVQLTRTKLAQALENAELRVIQTEGIFDPALHEVAGTRPSQEYPPGMILETVRPGYTWQGRILRPARVIVACAPPAGAAEQDGGPSSEDAGSSEETTEES